MANENDNILIKIGVDPSSISTVKQELRALNNEAQKIGIGRSLLSPEDQKAVLSRLASLKDSIKDVGQATGAVKGLEVFARTLGPVVSSFGALTGAAKMFGLEIKGVEKAEQIMMTTMNAALALQQLADLENMKAAISEKARYLQNILLIKQQEGATVQLTAVQRIWNSVASTTAGAIGIWTVAISAVVAGIYLLIKAFDTTTNEVKDYEKAIDGVIIKDDELRKEHNNQVTELTKLQTEYDVLTGKISDYEGELLNLQEEYELAIYDLEHTHMKKLDEIQEKHASFWNKIWMGLKFQILGPKAIVKEAIGVGNEIKQVDEDIEKQRQDITNKYEQKRKNLAVKHGKDIIEEDKKKYQALLSSGQLSREEIWKNEIKWYKKEANDAGLYGEQEKAYVKSHYDDIIKLVNEKANDLGKITPLKSLISGVTIPINFETRNIEKSFEPVIKVAKTAAEKIEETFNNLQINLNTSFPTTFANLTNIIKKWAEDSEITVSDWTNLISGAINEISNVILSQQTEIIQQTLQSDLDALEEETDSTMDELDKLYENNFITKEQYDKRKEEAEKKQKAEEKKLKKKAAQDEKDAQIFSSIINTAVAVTGALAQFGTLGPAAIALAVVVGVLGALETALIAAEPIPAFKYGGFVPIKAKGGYISGDSHAYGGVDINAEGGEYIINKNVAQRPGMGAFLNNINSGQVAPVYQGISAEDMNSIATAVTKSITQIPVNVTETEITTTQRKVSAIERRASW